MTNTKRKINDEQELFQRDANVVGVPATMFEQLVDNFPDMIHSVDDNGLIISVNQKGLQILGYDRDDLIGMPVIDIYDPSVHNNLIEGFDDLKKSGTMGVKSALITKGGIKVDIEVRSISLYDSDNNFVKTFTIIRDIKHLEELKSRDAQVSKMASVGEFAAGILHDLKNPMTIIGSYNGMSRKQFENGKLEKLPKYFNAIDKACDKANKLLTHIAQFVRNDTAKYAKVNLSEVLDDSFFMTEKAIVSHHVKIKNNLGDAEYFIEGNHSQLEQVFINIIKNACEAMDGSETREIEISAIDKPEEYIFRISDTGPGMSEHIRKNVFDSFFTTKPEGMGTGLGLSVTHRVVSEHQGSIKIESEEGKGTTFVITLPKKQYEQKESEASDAASKVAYINQK